MKCAYQRGWNDPDEVKPNYSQINLFQCYFVHHKSYMEYPDIEPGLRREKAAGRRVL
jgi:hypothetical protein